MPRRSAFDAPPSKPVRSWSPPEGVWAGRALFAGLGAGITILSAVVALVVASSMPLDRGKIIVLTTGFVLPWVGCAVVVVMRIRHGLRWRWISYLIGAITLPNLLMLAVIGIWRLSLSWRATDFDAAAWRAEEGRAWMVDDLLDRDLLEGRPLAEIEALLGPDEAAPRQVGYPDPFGYYVGGERQWVGVEWLVLQFDENGVVTSTELVGND